MAMARVVSDAVRATKTTGDCMLGGGRGVPSCQAPQGAPGPEPPAAKQLAPPADQAAGACGHELAPPVANKPAPAYLCIFIVLKVVKGVCPAYAWLCSMCGEKHVTLMANTSSNENRGHPQTSLTHATFMTNTCSFEQSLSRVPLAGPAGSLVERSSFLPVALMPHGTHGDRSRSCW